MPIPEYVPPVQAGSPFYAMSRRIAYLLDRQDWDSKEREKFRLRLQFANTPDDQAKLLGEIETAVMAMVVEQEKLAGVANAYGMGEDDA